MFDNELFRRASAYHNECNQLIAETAFILGVQPADFLIPFEKWQGGITLGYKDALELCKRRAVAGMPMLWDRPDAR